MRKIWRGFYYGRRLFLLMLLGGAALALCSCDSQPLKKEPVGESESQRVSITNTHLQELFAATSSPQAAASLDLSKHPEIDPLKPPLSLQDQAVWPLYSFLRGEVYRLRGEQDQAKIYYQKLVVFAGADPYKDGWGASGLAGVALWRWLQLAGGDQPVSPAEGKQLLDLAARIRKTRFLEEMFESSRSSITLPQLQEEILRSLLSLAWNLDRKKEAQGFFLEYLSLASSGELNQVEQALREELMSSGKISPGKEALLLGKRLHSLKDFNGATQWLNQAMERGDTQVKAEASYYLARLQRLKGGKDICATPKVLELLRTTIQYGADPDLVQEALFHRALLHIRESCPQNEKEFISDLEQLLKDFPYGRRADDALHQLAMRCLNRYWEDQDKADFDRAMQLFEKVREYQDQDDYLDSSWFNPAMAYYTRGEPGDRERAAALLQDLEKARPFGPLHHHALFWLGRLAEESGDQSQAAKHFRRIIEELPYSYYAIRARMHLNQGPQAARQFLMDGKTREQLGAKFQESETAISPSPTISGDSPYHQRLKRALDSRLYFQSLSAFIDIKRRESSLRSLRIENIPLAELDRCHLLAPTAVLLSLRQDALAAVSRNPDDKNRLEVAGAIRFMPKDDPAKPYGDWPLVIHLTGAMDQPLEVRSATQKDSRYLAIAYPPVFESMIMKHSKEFQVPPELIYAVIQQKSSFYPLNLSSSGDMGLFLFSKKTFDNLERKWKVLKEKQKSSRADFLFDPDASIYLGALFFGKELLPRYKHNQALSLMDFTSGYPAVKDWVEKWEEVGKDGDYEYIMETARLQADFTRSVFATMSLVQAAGLYSKQ